MRVTRTKKHKKVLNYYKKVHDFREPYQVIVTGDFIQESLLAKLNLIERLQDILCGATVKPLVTPCTLAALKALGDEYFGAFIYAKKYELVRHHCPHHRLTTDDILKVLPGTIDNERPVTSSTAVTQPHPPKEAVLRFTYDCIYQILSSTGNKYHYFLATQNDRLLRQCRKLGPHGVIGPGKGSPGCGVPTIHIHRQIMILDPLPSGNKETHAGRELLKTKVPEEEKEALRKLIPLEAKKKPLNSQKVVGKKKPKGPNPLSVKKRKPAPLELPLRPKRKNLPEASQQEAQ